MTSFSGVGSIRSELISQLQTLETGKLIDVAIEHQIVPVVLCFSMEFIPEEVVIRNTWCSKPAPLSLEKKNQLYAQAWAFLVPKIKSLAEQIISERVKNLDSCSNEDIQVAIELLKIEKKNPPPIDWSQERFETNMKMCDFMFREFAKTSAFVFRDDVVSVHKSLCKAIKKTIDSKELQLHLFRV